MNSQRKFIDWWSENSIQFISGALIDKQIFAIDGSKTRSPFGTRSSIKEGDSKCLKRNKSAQKYLLKEIKFMIW